MASSGGSHHWTRARARSSRITRSTRPPRSRTRCPRHARPPRGGPDSGSRGARPSSTPGARSSRSGRTSFISLISSETGKPADDSRVEVALVMDHLHWASRHAGRVLGKRRVSSGMLMFNHGATLEYRPLGVIGVIGPWNYPAHTPMGSISYALSAGNAVVFKPSEFTPGVGTFLASTFTEAVPEFPVFQVVTGFGETGAALVGAGVDKIAFTGSTPDRQEGHGRGCLVADAGAGRVRWQGRADRRLGRRPDRRRRGRDLGRGVERRPDVRGRGADLRGRGRSPTSSPRSS